MNKIISNPFITALGLPCVGKSSVMKELGRLCDFPVLFEPEENTWPAAVMERDLCGYINCLMWFRSIRVPMLFQAQRIQQNGQGVIMDSYYDKALKDYIGTPEMEWLLSPQDPYFESAKKMAELDWEKLPNASCVIGFRISFEDWWSLLDKRNRQFDKDPAFRKSFDSQESYLNSGKKLEKDFGIKYIEFEQKISSPEIAALELKALLQKEGIL